MSYIFLLLALLVTAVTAFGVSPLEITACTKSGVTCSATCDSVGLCVDFGNGLTWSTLKKCPNDQYCYVENDVNGTCVEKEDSNCFPNADKIGCLTDGTFPNPYNCKESLTCFAQEVGSSNQVCETNKAYDACTGTCDIDITDDKCDITEKVCNGIGNAKPLDINHRIFYFCAEDDNGLLYPVMGLCERGFFDEVSNTCTLPAAGCTP